MNTKKETSKNQKCICDESGLNEETRADIGHFKKCPQANIPNQIIEEGLKEFEEKFPSHISMNHGLKSFLLSSQTNLIKRLIEKVEGMKEREYMDMDEETQYFPENEKYNQALQKIIGYLKEGIKI